MASGSYEQETSDELLASSGGGGGGAAQMSRSSSALRFDKISASVGGAPGDLMLRQALPKQKNNNNNNNGKNKTTLRCDIIRPNNHNHCSKVVDGSTTIYTQAKQNLSSTNSSTNSSTDESNSMAPIVNSSSNQHTLINYHTSSGSREANNIEMQRRLRQLNVNCENGYNNAYHHQNHQDDPHLYCSVNNFEQATTFHNRQLPAATIYKSPHSMNHSYQTLVDKLNDQKAGYNRTLINHHYNYHGEQQLPANFRPGMQNCLPSQLYANGPPAAVYSNSPARLANNYSTLLPTTTTTTANRLISPIFSQTRTNNSSSSSDNFQPTTSEGKLMYFGGGSSSSGHAPRQLKWALRNPQSWTRLFVVLLIACLLLLLLAALTLFTSNANNFTKMSAKDEQPIQRPRIPASGGVQWPLADNKQDFLSLPNSSTVFINYHQNDLLGARFPNLPPEVLANHQVMHSWRAQTTTTTTSTTTSTPRPSTLPLGVLEEEEETHESSTQSYWRRDRNNNNNNANECTNCNGNGQCDSASGQCACFAGYSGPTCSNVDCPAGCSRRGECKLRSDWPLNSLATHATQTLAFVVGGSSLADLSSCSSADELLNYLQMGNSNKTMAARRLNSKSNLLSAGLYDSRLRWACECAPEFTGRDCGRRRELNCADGLDDDQDGLADCEDDDCCSQSACRDSLLCHRPPEPSKVLARQQPPAIQQLDELLSSAPSPIQRRANNLFAQWRFLIANGSLQSYSQERAFDKSRVAILRGRVRSVGPHDEGIVSVRVGVMESAAIGFTLTRHDGHFDLLVNGGDEWITLQFHRDAYAPVKRRTLARALAISTLDEEVQMALSSDQQQQQQQPIASEQRPAWQPFGLHWHAHLGALLDRLRQQSDERRFVQLRACLEERVSQISATIMHDFNRALVHPKLSDDFVQTPLHSFALVSQPSDSYTTKLKLNPTLEFAYNSASFPPASSIVKPTINIQLLPRNYSTLNAQSTLQLQSIELQLDIEGQLKRELLSVQPETTTELSYQFAWNRRNVYDQKVYGFGELNLRVVYEFARRRDGGRAGGAGGSPKPLDDAMRACGLPSGDPRERDLRRLLDQLDEQMARRVVTFRGRVHMEAHPLAQHADLGHWSLASSARYDPERDHLYLGTGATLPLRLVYPPVVSAPILLSQGNGAKWKQTNAGRLLARGPNSSMFLALTSGHDDDGGDWRSNRLIQLDSTATRRLLDVPLSIITSKFQSRASEQQQIRANRDEQDLQLVYNNFESALYVASKLAGKIVRVSLSSLVLLNRTLSSQSTSSSSSATLAQDEEIDIEPLCGFGGGREQVLAAESMIATTTTCKSLRLSGPHSMTLDEVNNLLYFIDGPRTLLALNLATNLLVNLSANSKLLDAGAACAEPSGNSQPPTLPLDEPLHSLAWSAVDSSLYFVHGSSAIVSLRADLSGLIVAQGINQIQGTNQRASSVVCSTNNEQPRPLLGSIKSLTIDGQQLVIVHQRKIGGDFLVAKMELGIGGGRLRQQIIDLHSAELTWNPLIGRFLNRQRRNQLNWSELSRRPASESRIPFIHLMGGDGRGFDRIDSLAISSDGSMFVWNARERSIRLISAYSPSKFNAHESARNPTIERLFVNTNPSSSSPSSASQRKPITSVILANPIALNEKQQQQQQEDELLEFDYTSGLLLTRTRTNAYAHSTRRWEFQYRILSNANKLTTADTPTPYLDEDDQNDLETKRLVLDYMRQHNSDRSSLALAASSAYVRLSSIKASFSLPEQLPEHQQQQQEGEYEFVRTYSGTRFVLQAIKLNQKQICEITTDRSGVLSTFIEQTAPNERTSWTELVYDPKTYLLQNVISKTVSKQSMSSLGDNYHYRQVNSSPPPPPPANSMFQSLFSPTTTTTTTINTGDHKLMRSTRRIIYDEIFNHYCDLFISDA